MSRGHQVSERAAGKRPIDQNASVRFADETPHTGSISSPGSARPQTREERSRQKAAQILDLPRDNFTLNSEWTTASNHRKSRSNMTLVERLSTMSFKGVFRKSTPTMSPGVPYTTDPGPAGGGRIAQRSGGRRSSQHGNRSASGESSTGRKESAVSTDEPRRSSLDALYPLSPLISTFSSDICGSGMPSRSMSFSEGSHTASTPPMSPAQRALEDSKAATLAARERRSRRRTVALHPNPMRGIHELSTEGEIRPTDTTEITEPVQTETGNETVFQTPSERARTLFLLSLDPDDRPDRSSRMLDTWPHRDALFQPRDSFASSTVIPQVIRKQVSLAETQEAGSENDASSTASGGTVGHPKPQIIPDYWLSQDPKNVRRHSYGSSEALFPGLRHGRTSGEVNEVETTETEAGTASINTGAGADHIVVQDSEDGERGLD